MATNKDKTVLVLKKRWAQNGFNFFTKLSTRGLTDTTPLESL